MVFLTKTFRIKVLKPSIQLLYYQQQQKTLQKKKKKFQVSLPIQLVYGCFKLKSLKFHLLYY